MSIKLYSPAKVILVDVNDFRLNLAKEQGLADVIVNSSKEDPLEVILKETDGRGADVYKRQLLDFVFVLLEKIQTLPIQ